MALTLRTAIAHSPARRRLAIGIIAALVTIAGWTAWTLATRHAIAGTAYRFSPMELATLRFGTAAIAFAPFWWRIGLKPARVSWPLIVGLLGAGLPFALVVGAGFRLAPASDAAPLVTGTLPLLSALGSALLFGERFSASRKVGLALIGFGALAVIANSIAAGHILGDLLFLLGAVLWTSYALAFRRAGLAPWEAAGLVAIWSFLAVLPFGAPELIHSISVAPAGAVLGQVFFQGLISGVVSLLAYTLAVSNLGAARATAITAIVPVTAGLAAIVFLGEDITLVTATGATVTTLGVLFASGAFKAPFTRD